MNEPLVGLTAKELAPYLDAKNGALLRQDSSNVY